jgi:hypothetical protein
VERTVGANAMTLVRDDAPRPTAAHPISGDANGEAP